MTERPDCAQVREIAAELALGLASGGERAAAVEHLAGCAECRALVAELTDVADQVLQLAPEAEPPPGFETRVLRSLHPAPSTRPRRRWLVAAAVVSALGIGAVGGAALFRPERSRLEREYLAALEALGGRALAGGTLEDGRGRPVGQVFLYSGDVSWLFVTVDDPGAAGMFVVELTRKDGSRTRVPGLRLTDGRGSLGERAPVRLRELRTVAVIDADGERRYTAQFRFG